MKLKMNNQNWVSLVINYTHLKIQLLIANLSNVLSTQFLVIFNSSNTIYIFNERSNLLGNLIKN